MVNVCPLAMDVAKYKQSDKHQADITDAVVTYIAGDLLSLSTVESSRFRAMIDPRYQVPSRKHLTSKLLPLKTSDVQKDLRLIARLKQADKICATIDLWSSRQMRSYYGVTGHFILDWTLHSVMLACSRFRGSHTAEANAEQFKNTTAIFGISNKISHIVTDNASNMIKAF